MPSRLADREMEAAIQLEASEALVHDVDLQPMSAEEAQRLVRLPVQPGETQREQERSLSQGIRMSM